ncbi:MAG: LdpA C-terminal domain-containing domain [Elainellaceae cyanobacterium]
MSSLREGNWFKLICGASYQHLPAVRNLALAYSLAGADCVDIAADPAVVSSVCEAFQVADQVSQSLDDPSFFYAGRPWLMVSLNDGDDPHFRKAFFDPQHCPSDCSRPCERICPAAAIAMSPEHQLEAESGQEPPRGVIEARCYGCGRCVPVCPIEAIETRSHQIAPHEIAASVLPQVDAIEIHTCVGHGSQFQALWQAIAPYISSLKLVAVSCPDGPDLVEYLRSLHQMMVPHPAALVWQTDGRPMSGDIGRGTTHASIHLAQKVLAAKLPGYVQLAGGTNAYTVPKLRSLQLLHPYTELAGVAYGSYARALLQPVLEELEARSHLDASVGDRLETQPDLLQKAVDVGRSLVQPLKPLPCGPEQIQLDSDTLHLRSLNMPSFSSQGSQGFMVLNPINDTSFMEANHGFSSL